MPIEVTATNGRKYVLEQAQGESDQSQAEALRNGSYDWIRTTRTNEWISVRQIVSFREVAPGIQIDDEL